MSFSDEWFEQMYGKEPYPQQSAETLLSEIHYANKHLLNSESRLLERQLWEARRDGARAGWRKAQEGAENGIFSSLTREVLLRIAPDFAAYSTPSLAEEVEKRYLKLKRKAKALEGENVAKRLADDEADNIHRAMAVLVNLLNDKYDCATFRPLGVAEAVASKVRTLVAKVKELEADYARAVDGQKRYAKLVDGLMVSNELLRGKLEEAEARKAKGGDAD